METEGKIYRLYSEDRTYEETKQFIEQYRESILLKDTRYSLAVRLVPLKSSVLDYGCGWGLFAEMLHGIRNCRVKGIDIDEGSIDIAKDFVGEKDGLTFAAQHIGEIANESFDVVASMQVLEHTHNPGNYLAQCNRVLKNGGRLVISVPNIITPRHILPLLRLDQGNKLKRIFAAIRSQQDKTQDHLHAWDPTTFSHLLASLGFDYEGHIFAEGVAFPFRRYWRTKLPGIRNLSYTMIFAVVKVAPIEIAPDA